MVGMRGFEPPTSCSRSMRATRLRHIPTEFQELQKTEKKRQVLFPHCGMTPAGKVQNLKQDITS